MSEKTAKNDDNRSMMKKPRFALIAALLISLCIGLGWQGSYEANAAMKMHNSVDMLSTKWSGTWNGWGVAGGKYGQFTCATCHASSTTNIKRIKTSFTAPDTSKGQFPGALAGATVTFLSTTGGLSPMGQDTLETTANARICHYCHSATGHNRYMTSGTPTAHKGSPDCTDCHSHANGFTGGDCIGCHTSSQNNVRAKTADQLINANSHHIQGVTLTNQHCYACHWEANPDGSPNSTYHTQTSNQTVDLVIWGTYTTRPTVDSAATRTTYLASAATRTEYAKINTHCLGCHNANNQSTTPFAGDTHDTHYYSWDGTSIDQRYTQPTGSTTWGKYTAAPNSAPKNIKKAYSAHGNAANNQLGWDLTNGYDGALTNFTGGTNVLCFDCHNSHGSSVTGGMTTNYTSSTRFGYGGLLKDVTNGQGGYSVTYQAAAGGSAANKNFYNPGAGICFDCHMETTVTQTQHPWGYNTFGSTSAIVGFQTSTYFGPGMQPLQSRAAYVYKQGRGGSKGGHFGASSAINSTPTNTIKALCTPCHDPHGVSPNLGVNQAYAVPLLKGTWMTSPYKEDAAPASTIERRGGGCATVIGYSFASTPGWHLDQNTFTASSKYSPGRSYTVSAYSWPAWPLVNKVTETAGQFAGLCLSCHAQSAIQTTTGGGWKTRDRVHNTVSGWRTSGSGSNVNNQMHSFTCSKCHVPHNSTQNRLMATNCMNFAHRGRVASGGWPGGVSPAGVQMAGTSGGGTGRFPSGGGGYAASSSGKNWAKSTSGVWFLGIRPASRSPQPTALRPCLDNASGASGFAAWPTIELWNSRTTW